MFFNKNLLSQYLIWHFYDAPKSIIKAWKNFLFFNLNYFSIGLLLKTLFSPWRKYRWVYPTGFKIWECFEVFVSNSVSRFLGALVRIVLIIFGILIEVFLIFAGMIILVFWLILPILLIAMPIAAMRRLLTFF